MRFFLVLALSLFPAVAWAGQSNIQLVGQNALYGRGMNAALALYDHYVYIGNRTDASSTCVGATGLPKGTGCAHPHPGILIVDAKDPANPAIVGEIGPPYAGLVGITTRELRVWPDKKLLIVMSFRCSRLLHACAEGTDKQFPFDLKFFNLADPLHPKFVTSYVPTSKAGAQVKPHEMFLWVDPKNANRAMLFISTPELGIDPTHPNLIVADISEVPQGGAVREVAEGNWNNRFPGTSQANYPVDKVAKKCGPYDCNLFVHSMGVTDDGSRTFLAMEAGEFLVLDTSAVAQASSATAVVNLNDKLLTDPVNRPTWQQNPPGAGAVPLPCPKACPDGHSAVKVPGRQLVLTTDEVYGTYTDPAQGCPWGWERLIDVSDPAHPSIVGSYKISEDSESYCKSIGVDSPTNQYTSYSSHNPTVLPHLAIVDWHSGGLQISDISNAANPVQAGWFLPQPLAQVATEDPALTRGGSKVAMWSYPVIKDGLIYAIDIRNGLFILRYTGPHADEVNAIKFLEGNSNLGDEARLEAGR
jgi:hypothetical protein